MNKYDAYESVYTTSESRLVKRRTKRVVKKKSFSWFYLWYLIGVSLLVLLLNLI